MWGDDRRIIRWRNHEMIFGQDAAQAAIIEQSSSMIGDSGAKAIEGMLAGAQRMKHGVIANALEIHTRRILRPARTVKDFRLSRQG